MLFLLYMHILSEIMLYGYVCIWMLYICQTSGYSMFVLYDIMLYYVL